MVGAVLLAATLAAADPAPVLAIAPGALAQSIETTTPPAKRETPPPAIPDRDLRPTPPPVPHTPGFLTPLTRTTKNGPMGIAGWTAPNPPMGARGAADPESSGAFGFGLAAEWGRPIPPREAPEAVRVATWLRIPEESDRSDWS